MHFRFKSGFSDIQVCVGLD
uniref:Uncharacterized protein n=1 Tax=Anguilla anguilla TaxID=7936 RepID=A0A0E9SNW7_ANGAN